jgi:hypothetical protein
MAAKRQRFDILFEAELIPCLPRQPVRHRPGDGGSFRATAGFPAIIYIGGILLPLIRRRRSMRSVITIIWAALLAGCVSPTHSTRRQTGKPYDPSIPTSPSGCIPVVVSFTGDEWMDADEMKHKAKQRLIQEGHQLDDSYQCRINVELIGRGAGC